MPTLSSYILAARIERHVRRLASLAELNAPECMLAQEQHLLAQAHAGQLGKVDALNKADPAVLLAAEYTSVRWGTGKGGKAYAAFTTAMGEIRYFPQGKFGPFLAL